MCVAIDWEGERVATQQKLADKAGEEVVKQTLGETPFEGEVCLCPVDVPTVLNAAGISWTHGTLPEYVVTDTPEDNS